MIGYIRGILEEADEQSVMIDNHGIGYRIFVPSSAFSGALPIGKEVKIYTYLSVKEDAMQLYGFLTRDDLRMFRMLLGVNGIGPKAGLGILSALTADELRFAVLADDAASIAKAPGIGKKTAQKLILELKDKLNLEDAFEQKLANQAAGDISAADTGSQVQEAVQALTALGYPGTDALRAVKKVEGAESMTVEEILKAALKKMI
ncbi:MAG: Holliday junction branch migration protein RuvA [Oliverpabstia sp.]|nr:Holliday junction branch migration protein RuvA [Oliverpabstia sp.]